MVYQAGLLVSMWVGAPVYCSAGSRSVFCMRLANERWRYIVTSSLIGWVHTQSDPWWAWRKISWHAFARFILSTLYWLYMIHISSEIMVLYTVLLFSRHLLHHCFQALMDHGVRVSEVLSEAYQQHCCMRSHAQAPVIDKAVTLGFSLGKACEKRIWKKALKLLVEWGLSPWWPLLGLLTWYMYLSLWSSFCISFEDCRPVDKIYGYQIFKWNAETWLPLKRKGQGSHWGTISHHSCILFTRVT